MATAAVTNITRTLARAIDRASLSQDTVVHRYYGQADEDFSVAVVRIEPRSIDVSESSRAQHSETTEVAVRVIKRVTADDEDEIDDLLYLCQEIRDLFRRESLASGAVHWNGERVDTIYDVDELLANHKFVQDMTLTYVYERTT